MRVVFGLAPTGDNVMRGTREWQIQRASTSTSVLVPRGKQQHRRGSLDRPRQLGGLSPLDHKAVVNTSFDAASLLSVIPLDISFLFKHVDPATQ